MSNMQDIQLFITPPHSCSYLPDRASRMLFIDPNIMVTTHMLSELSRQGFRRSGDFVYKPECKHCRQCLPVRLPVDLYTPNKSQKRTAKRNQDITLKVISSRQATAIHYELYAKYINNRHYDGDMYPPSLEQFKKFLVHGCSDSLFFEFWLDNTLICVAVSDILDDGLSAVYTFFDTSYDKRSLGTLAILTQIEWVKSQGLDFLYLGYWVPEAPKMKYKNNFLPLDLMINNQWHRVTHKYTDVDIGKLLIALNTRTHEENILQIRG